MTKESVDLGTAVYILGILSIVLGFLSPVAGLVLGIIGINQGKKEKGELAKRGLRFSKLGIVISIVVIILLTALTLFSLYSQGTLSSFSPY